MRQYAGFTSAKESNERYRYLLEHGQTGISVAFDLPTQIGYDSDHSMAMGEVGRVGVPISTIEDMEMLLKDIPLDKVSTSMTINATAPILLALYISAAEDQGVVADKLRGTIQNDVLKEYIARGTYIYPPDASMRLVTDIFDFCSTHVPNWNTISISGSTLTAQQIDNNVGRTTIQALSAVLGGTQSLHTNSRDEALSLPTDEAAKLALRTQQIIAHESGITQFADPLGGSEVIEKLTLDLEEEALDIIAKIDEMGGALSAIEAGWIQEEIGQSAYEYQKKVDAKEQVIVGVNQFSDEDEPDIEMLEISTKAEEEQITQVKAFREARDSPASKAALSQLKSNAKGTDNLIPAIIDCVQNKCTLGEIADSLREIFGEHQV
jgi:methylmalonyl-CoA mutase N-terminal domain/subunit